MRHVVELSLNRLLRQTQIVVGMIVVSRCGSGKGTTRLSTMASFSSHRRQGSSCGQHGHRSPLTPCRSSKTVAAELTLVAEGTKLETLRARSWICFRRFGFCLVRSAGGRMRAQGPLSLHKPRPLGWINRRRHGKALHRQFSFRWQHGLQKIEFGESAAARLGLSQARWIFHIHVRGGLPRPGFFPTASLRQRRHDRGVR